MIDLSRSLLVAGTVLAVGMVTHSSTSPVSATFDSVSASEFKLTDSSGRMLGRLGTSRQDGNVVLEMYSKDNDGVPCFRVECGSKETVVTVGRTSTNAAIRLESQPEQSSIALSVPEEWGQSNRAGIGARMESGQIALSQRAEVEMDGKLTPATHQFFVVNSKGMQTPAPK